MADIDEEIEYQYTPSQFVKAYPQKIACSTYIQQFEEATKIARERFDNIVDILYGDKTECRIDLYRCKDAPENANVFIFIHGGYWQECSKNHHGMVAFPVMEANAIAAVVGYTLAPHDQSHPYTTDRKASMDEIVSQIYSSIEVIWKRFLNSKLYLCGHSAGAHLAAMVLTQSQWHDSKIPSCISGAMLLSGIYDLSPLLKTSINIALKMDKDIATRNSPLLLLRDQKPGVICPVILAYAELDPPRIKEQSLNFCEKLKNHGMAATCMEIDDTDHFSLISKLTDINYKLSQEIMKMVMG